ncbi:hypothetical protein BST61_g1202 [Cercospora zeina]
MSVTPRRQQYFALLASIIIHTSRGAQLAKHPTSEHLLLVAVATHNGCRFACPLHVLKAAARTPLRNNDDDDNFAPLFTMPQHKRGPWSQAEDNLLLHLVDQYGASNWVRISSTIQTRSPKQCRERFHQNLKPNLNHDPITPEEGVLIEQMVAEMGKRWAEIARRLRGRSDNAVKNWWNGGMNRRRRNQQQRQAEFEIRHHHPHAHPNMHSLPSAPVQQPLPQAWTQQQFFPQQQQYMGNPGHAHPQQYAHFPTAVATFGRMVEAPLPSPSTYSQMSADGAPSLISDCSSLDNRSPRHGPSPNPIELPPLAGSREERRSSAPMLRLGVPGTFAQDTDFMTMESFGDLRKHTPMLQEAFMPQSTSLPAPTAYLPSQPRHSPPMQQTQHMQQSFLMASQHASRRHSAYPGMQAHIPSTPMDHHHNMAHAKYDQHKYYGHIDSGMATPIIAGHSPDDSPKDKMSLSNLTH